MIALLQRGLRALFMQAEAIFNRAYGDRLTRFLEIKHRLDPQGLFQNDQARRLGLV